MILIGVFSFPGETAEGDNTAGNQKYKIDGKVTVPFTTDQDWLSSTRILVDGGEFIGFLK